MFWIITREKSPGDIAVTSTYLKIIKKSIESAGSNCKIWDGVSRINKKDYLIFDECKTAILYILKGYNNIIVWIQGVVPEEALMKGYAKYRYIIHSILEYITLCRAKVVFFCSNEMRTHYESKYRLVLSNKSFIMPCFNEDDISNNDFFRTNKYKNNSFLYVGTLNVWQCFEETVQIYKEIEQRTDKKTYLYVYTPDQDKAIRILEKYQIKNYTLDYLPADKLGKKLGEFKYGFVLRKDNIVNRVATPTKLSNYIAHGVIPIYSDCLRSFHEYKKKSNGFAVVCNLEKKDEGVANIISSMQEDISPNEIKDWCRKTFKSYYNQKDYINRIRVIIKSLN